MTLASASACSPFRQTLIVEGIKRNRALLVPLLCKVYI